jgi:hypothetical protein
LVLSSGDYDPFFGIQFHFLFSSKDKTEWPDVFAREASIIGQVRSKEFFVADTCRFDIMQSKLFNSSHNINNISFSYSSSWF